MNKLLFFRTFFIFKLHNVGETMSKTCLLSFALLATIVCAVPALERASVEEGTIGANQPNGQTGEGKSFPVADTDREKGCQFCIACM